MAGICSLLGLASGQRCSALTCSPICSPSRVSNHVYQEGVYVVGSEDSWCGWFLARAIICLTYRCIMTSSFHIRESCFSPNAAPALLLLVLVPLSWVIIISHAAEASHLLYKTTEQPPLVHTDFASLWP
ncbi:hypothetical protein F4777DRAFT_315724 [Nemania sp. FL0916]|nr:hypothetical protein F4777DRAFT_315724 [Nemania sp. FL0916]